MVSTTDKLYTARAYGKLYHGGGVSVKADKSKFCA